MRLGTWLIVLALLFGVAGAAAQDKPGGKGESKPAAAPPPGQKTSTPHAPDAEGRPWILIETDRLQKWMGRENVRILDVRSAEAFKKGHLPNALNLPVQSLEDPRSRIQGRRKDDATLAEMFGRLGIGRDSWVVIYDDQAGHLGTRLFWIFHYFGHQRMFMLNGGIDRWVAEKRPLVQGTVTFGPQIFPIDLTPRRLATAEWILDHMKDPDVVIVDVRDPKTYTKGHIVGAVNVPHDWSVRADKTWKSPAELKKMFEERKITPDKNIVVYCQFGRMNAHTYATLKWLGYARVRSYDLSWAEWATDPSLTVKGTREVSVDEH